MKSILVLALLFIPFSAAAQRKVDPLDRGLVAVKVSSGVFVSWRVLSDEYYDVKYNLYRNDTRIASDLDVSNYSDASGSASSTYSVAPVVNGVEGTKCEAVTPWSNRTGNGPQYLPIKVADVKDRNGNYVWQNVNGTVTSTQNYTINDISLGDVDGDGKIDFIVKRKNQTDQDELFPTSNTTAFCRIEVYTSKKNYQLAWYIDCGPNTVYGADEQWDAVAFDWDQDGKCEVLYRAYGNTIIHKADGSTTTIGSNTENIRAHISHTANMTFTNCGTEYLVYMNGETGAPYTTMEYPLKRLESSEYNTSIDWSNASDVSSKISGYLSAVSKAWGDNYGHRSSKYFMGAPYLDGRNPSIYLGRGIYTRTKMIAYDVNPTTHALTQKWTWSNNTSGSGWYGQGYHNYSIADVDEDGCDEIVYGSMVIDNNGKGLSTTGLGHGDASHTGDLDPFRKGLETFACNEDEPGNNYRNAATCEIYYRNTSSGDDGRAMAGNFTNEYPGSIGASTSSGVISLTSDKTIDGMVNNWNANTPSPLALNIRIYWDGDLLSETVNGPGSSEGYMFVDKLGQRIFDTGHGNYETQCIGGTKKNLNAHGDIIGDWREEIVIRSSDNTEFRIYTTNVPTSYRIPCLWFDHQYRQAMVWQTEGYNQPPHPSFFLGELEGITAAPPPLTNTGKTEIEMDGTITAEQNGKDLLVVVEPSKATNGYSRYDMKYSGGISPKSLTINVPTLVSGNNDNNNITRKEYTCLLRYADASATFTGSMRLIKQGEGLLNLYKKTLNHTGQTDIWGGTLKFDGTFTGSKVWMNRHTTLNTASGTFNGGIEMNYNSTLNVTNSVTVSDLILNYGSRVVLNVASTSDAAQNSQLKVNGKLTVDKKNWHYGPKYQTPVLQVNSASALTVGNYPIGTVSTVEGSLEDIVIEGNFASKTKQELAISNGTLYLNVYDDNFTSLAFTSSVQGGSNASGTFVNQEKHYYNNWGASSWAAQAYIGFNVTIPSGKTISAATLNFTSYCGGNYDGRSVQVYLLNKDDAAAFDVNNMTLSTAKGAKISDQVDNRTESLKTIEFSSDNLAALNKATTPGSTVTVIFQLSNAAAGAYVYGSGSSSKAPTLSITLQNAASDTNPIDKTSLIVDAGFDGAAVSGNEFGAWTWEKSVGSNGPQYPYNATAANTTAAEFWNPNASNLTFNLQQTISNLPAGTYKLTVDARNSYNGVAAAGNDGAAYLYATVDNDDVFHSSKIIPTTGGETSDVSTFEVIFRVTEGADVTVGIKNVGSMDARWLWIDNFTLTYYGTQSEKGVTPDATITESGYCPGNIVGTDDTIDIADLAALIDLINNPPAEMPRSADVDGDNDVDIDDIKRLLLIILGKE